MKELNLKTSHQEQDRTKIHLLDDFTTNSVQKNAKAYYLARKQRGNRPVKKTFTKLKTAILLEPTAVGQSRTLSRSPVYCHNLETPVYLCSLFLGCRRKKTQTWRLEEGRANTTQRKPGRDLNQSLPAARSER